MKPQREDISLKHAVLLKSAELWLRLGEPLQALLELQQLPERVRRHPRVQKVCRSAHQNLSA